MENSNELEKEIERPVILNVMMVASIIGGIAIIPLAFSDLSKNIGSWYPPYLIISYIIGLSCNIAMWNMKKIGFWIYATLVAINQIIMLATGIWNIGALIIPGIFIFLVSKHLNKMT